MMTQNPDAIFGGVLAAAALVVMMRQVVRMRRAGEFSQREGGMLVAAFGWWIEGSFWLLFPNAASDTRLGVLFISGLCFFGGMSLYALGRRSERRRRT